MKKIFLLVSGLLILASVPITILFINKNQELRSRAAPATSLSFTPSSLSVRPNENFSLDVTINTGQNLIAAVEIHVIYDQKKIEALSITNGPQFPNILSSGVIDNGVASITVGAPSATQLFSGTGTVATIRFKALEPTASPISVRFGQETFAGSPAEGATNALVNTNPATITVLGSTSTTTPTPTQTAGTPTPTQSSTTGSPTPTGTLTVTPLLVQLKTRCSFFHLLTIQLYTRLLQRSAVKLRQDPPLLSPFIQTVLSQALLLQTQAATGATRRQPP